MQIGFIGLGKMGKNMVLKLLDEGVEVVAWNRSPGPREEVAAEGAIVVDEVTQLSSRLESPRILWLMLPAGDLIDQIIRTVSPTLSDGDIIIDGGNSFFRDSIRRADELSAQEIHYMDAGVSGGPEGARLGSCLLVGGEVQDYRRVEGILTAMSAPEAFSHLGPVGAGHFAKMVHNGIEYGMMQAIAEGATILKRSELDYDLSEVFRVYNRRSVIESRLVGWTQEVLENDPGLADVTSEIAHTGEGEWTIKMAEELGVDVPVIETSLNVRKSSTMESKSFRDKIVSALRGKFGGHSVTKETE